MERPWVKVLVGSVLVILVGQPLALGQDDGEEKGKEIFLGQVVEKGDHWILVRGEDDQSKKFFPTWKGGKPKDGGHWERKMDEALRRTREGDKVKIGWRPDDKARVVELEILEKAPREGLFEGVVEERGDKWFLVKNDDGDSMRFTPRWLGGLPKEGGGLEKGVLDEIRKLRVGDRVKVLWEYDVRARALKIQSLAQTERKGVFHGVIEEKGASWFRVKNEEEQSMRFTPRWIGGLPRQGGGLDKKMVQLILQLRAGDEVKVRWEWDDCARAVHIQMVKRAPR